MSKSHFRMKLKGETWGKTFAYWMNTRVFASSVVFRAIAVATAYAGLIIPIAPPIVTSVDLLIGTVVTVIVGPLGSIIVDLIGIPLVSPTPDLGTVAVGIGYIIYSFGFYQAYKFYLAGSRLKMIIMIWVSLYFGETIVKMPIIAAWVVYIYHESPSFWGFLAVLFPGDIIDTAVFAVTATALMLAIPKFMRPLWVYFSRVEEPAPAPSATS